MASTTPSRTTDTSGYAYDTAQGAGWLAFAGTMLLIDGTLNVIYGIAAIDNSKVFVNNAQFVLSDLNTWGWVLLCIGVAQVLAGFGIFAGNQAGRWLGIISASANAIIQLVFISTFPLLSLAIFSVDILIIYGLVAYGGRRQAV